MKTPSRKMSPEVVVEIRNHLASGLFHQHQIAAKVGVNPGRVSETKHGVYDWMLPQTSGQQSLF